MFTPEHQKDTRLVASLEKGNIFLDCFSQRSALLGAAVGSGLGALSLPG